MRVQAFESSLFAEHREPAGHPERRERYFAALRGVQASRVAPHTLQRQARPASPDELLSVHSSAHLDLLASSAGRAGYLDADTYFSPHSYQAAVHAAGAACQMVQDLVAGEADYGIVVSRPPGHHACVDRAMGFCLLNNVAIAAAAARAAGIARVAIVDWDVHHGNGTESIFYNDPHVLYVSTHQSPQYPGTGAVTDVGEGDGRGFTINIPLTAGANDAVYHAAFVDVVLPVVEQFAPDLVLVSAGFDSHMRDPLGDMRVTDDGFGALMRLVLERLPERGKGRVGIVLEGGYHLGAIERSVSATLSAFDPAAEFAASQPDASPAPVGAPWQSELARARQRHSAFWSF